MFIPKVVLHFRHVCEAFFVYTHFMEEQKEVLRSPVGQDFLPYLASVGHAHPNSGAAL